MLLRRTHMTGRGRVAEENISKPDLYRTRYITARRMHSNKHQILSENMRRLCASVADVTYLPLFVGEEGKEMASTYNTYQRVGQQSNRLTIERTHA